MRSLPRKNKRGKIEVKSGLRAVFLRNPHERRDLAMKHKIDSTRFGSITVDGETYDYDIMIRLSGEIEKRKKKLSKERYGTSHIISPEEAEELYEKGCGKLIIGTGQEDNVRLSEEARRYLDEHEVTCILESTPRAITTWNESKGAKIGLFHVTC